MNTAQFRKIYVAFYDPFRFLTEHLKTLDPVGGVTPFPDWRVCRKSRAFSW